MNRTRLTGLAAAAIVSFALLPAATASAEINVPLPLPTGCIDAVVLSVNCQPDTGQPICKDAALQPTRLNLAKIRSATLCLVNLERTSRGIPKLKNNTKLGRSAKSFSLSMVVQHFFSHVAPNGSTLTDRVSRAAYLKPRPKRWYLGENIGYGTRYAAQPAQIVFAWMNSPAHRANMLDARFREAGIGTAMGTPTTPYGATYVTEFGRRIR